MTMTVGVNQATTFFSSVIDLCVPEPEYASDI